MRKTVSAFLAVFMCLFLFTACGGRTIEERISKAQLQKMCDEVKSDPQFKSVFSDVKVEVEGNNITYGSLLRDACSSSGPGIRRDVNRFMKSALQSLFSKRIEYHAPSLTELFYIPCSVGRTG